MKLPNFGRARARLTTSAEVQAETERHRTLLADTSGELAQLDAARRDVLLSDDVGTIREHEARTAELRIMVARLKARLEALGEQAVEVAAAEAATALEARRVAVVARSAEAAAWLRDAWPALAQDVVDALHSLHEVEREVVAVNAAMAEAGRDGPELPGVQARLGITLGGASMQAGSVLASGMAVSLGGLVDLPELLGGVQAPGWTPRPWS